LLSSSYHSEYYHIVIAIKLNGRRRHYQSSESSDIDDKDEHRYQSKMMINVRMRRRKFRS